MRLLLKMENVRGGRDVSDDFPSKADDADRLLPFEKCAESSWLLFPSGAILRKA